MSNSKVFLAFALIASLLVAGCSTIRALGQVDQIGEVRQALIEFLPDYSLRSIQSELDYLDDVYAGAQSIISQDADLSATDVVLTVMGAPETFDEVGDAYQSIYNAVKLHAYNYNKKIPSELIVFDDAMRPAYSELKAAINANDQARRGIEVLVLLRPLVALII